MAHAVGERLRWDECGAEITFTKPCPCPEAEPKKHADICCGKRMRKLGTQAASKGERPQPRH